ncbi:hypothetical protein BD626DRAFT_550493 [Schizophyllum amplum]|uniref:Uncharacterized protein n=1 Tax=Schizophyllum amplum TaxID=97359 RepID=A0A550C307_9AGAR|nr:hypothetical protein BD626DRAFT_550493 [Auriculariopsis ampla]
MQTQQQPRERIVAKPNRICQPPQTNSRVVMMLWRWKIWVEGTFIFSMLEPWEKILIASIFLVLLSLIFMALFKYLPQHLIVMHRRAVYYLWGEVHPSLAVRARQRPHS